MDGAADGRFERRLRWLVAVLLLLVLLLTGSQLVAGPAWSEMPADRVLLTVTRGEVDTVSDGERVRLRPGGRSYLGAGDRVQVAAGGFARLTLHGGSVVLLCAGSEVTVGTVGSDGVRPVAPAGELELAAGTVLLDTASASAAFVPASLAVRAGGRTVTNRGEAWYAVGRLGARVALGVVAVDGAPVPPTGAALTCGDGVPVERPVGSPGPLPAAAPTRSPTASPSASASATPGPASPSPPPTPTPSPTLGVPPPDPGDPDPPPDPTTRPATSAPPASPTPTPSPSPGDPVQPVIGPITAADREIYAITVTGGPCNQIGPDRTRLRVVVTDRTDPPRQLAVQAVVRLGGVLVYDGMLGYDGKYFSTRLGPYREDRFSMLANPIHVVVRATDPAGNRDETKAEGFLTLFDCREG